jgi:hypothetical protein
MAKTRKTRKISKPSTTTTHRPPPSKPVEWTVDALTLAINATSVDEDIALLKQAGILTKGGKLAKRYTSWGDKVSRTPEINESGEMHD